MAGTHGSAPARRSSRLGWVAAVIAIVPPSHPRPAVSQSTSMTSSGAIGVNRDPPATVIDQPRSRLRAAPLADQIVFFTRPSPIPYPVADGQPKAADHISYDEG